MAAPQAFSLPIESDHAGLASYCLDVLKFNSTGDLLATGGSDCLLKVFSFSKDSYVFRKKLSSPIITMEWKPNFFGIFSLFLGLHDGSILLLTFSVGESPVCCIHFILPRQCSNIPFQYDLVNLVEVARRSEPITFLAYHEGILISSTGVDVVFWANSSNSGRYLILLERRSLDTPQIYGRGNGP